MTTTTPPRPVSLHIYLGCRDAPAALDWLPRALGAEVTMSWPDEDGGIAHAELRIGDAAFIVFSDPGHEPPVRRGETSGQGVYLAVPDDAAVDAAFARATAAGAEVVWTPDGTAWGNYRARVVDPEGREWTFGTHRPGEPVTDDAWS